MKGRITILIITVWFIAHSVAMAATIEMKYSFDKNKLSSDGRYNLIGFSNCFLSGKAGEPALPYQKVSLVLPPGETAVSVEFVGENLTEIPGQYVLYPYQYSRPVGEEDSNPKNSVVNDLIYRLNKDLPLSHTGRLSTGYLHGFPLAVCTFTPVVYNPYLKKLGYYKEVRIRIQTRADNKPQSHLPWLITPETLKQLRKIVQNPGMLSLYPPITSDTADYEVLIITPEIFSGHFTDLTDNYFVRGMKSRMITTSSIYSNYSGQDNQEKIRNCIIHEYQYNHIQHVLLAGDAELIPPRGFWAEVQSSSLITDVNIPADLYYAALDGNWNADGDNRWAEPGEDDLYPELSVGRFTVSTIEELDNAINKNIHYQNFPVTADCRKPLMVGEKLWDNPLTWGGDYLDLLIGPHSDNGYTTHGIPEWHPVQKLYDRDLPAPWTLTDLLARINEGASFLHHSGHSNTDYLMRMGLSSVTNSNFQQINGIAHNFIPVYTHGCYCAAFDMGDCIAEKMLNINNFAVAFIGNSRYGWFNEGTTEGPSEHLHREFADALYHDKVGQAGKAHTLSKISTVPWVNAPGQWEEGALRWCFYTCNLLGDPAMFVWTDVPMDLNIIHPDTLTVSSISIPVQCDTAGSAVEGLICVALKDSIMLGRAITNSSGICDIPISLQSQDTGLITLIISGYNCKPDTSYIHVAGMASVSGVISYENQALTPLDSVMVMLIQTGDTLAQTLSDSSGHFIFQDIPSGEYQVKLHCTHAWGGTNSTDALQILRHFVHILQLNGLALKASDIDNNHVTNSVDAFAVQKRFVGMMSYFPGGDWVFEDKTITVGLSGETIINIHGLCKGDVNKSFTPLD